MSLHKIALWKRQLLIVIWKAAVIVEVLIFWNSAHKKICTKLKISILFRFFTVTILCVN